MSATTNIICLVCNIICVCISGILSRYFRNIGWAGWYVTAKLVMYFNVGLAIYGLYKLVVK